MNRALIIEAIEQATDTRTRMDLQQQLTQINADIKHLNKLEAADAQRAATVRKSLGRKEAEANEARHQEREQRNASSELEREEALLLRAKQLHRELDRYPRVLVGAREPRIAALIPPLAEFIEAQKAHVKGVQIAEAQRDATWRDTWKDGEGGKADDHA